MTTIIPDQPLPRRTESGMHTRAVNAAAGVLLAAMQQGRQTPTGLALALDSAQLLNSPEHATETTRMRGELAKTLEQAAAAQLRVTELEVAAVEARAALAALCYDLDDPGSYALGALYLLQQATPGVPMERGETVPKVYRASHDSIVMGLYLTPAAAQEHCEVSACRSIVGDISLDWIEDEEDGVSELVFTRIDGVERTSGYVVDALEIALRYDETADE